MFKCPWRGVCPARGASTGRTHGQEQTPELHPLPAVPCHLQNLISLLDALPVSRAALLHPRHEDAHVIAPSQPQPDGCAFGKADHPGVGAVPGRGGRGRVRLEGAGRGYAGCPWESPHPLRASVSQTAPYGRRINRLGPEGRTMCPREAAPGCVGLEPVGFLSGGHTRGPPRSGCWTPCRCRSYLASGSLKGNSSLFPKHRDWSSRHPAAGWPPYPTVLSLSPPPSPGSRP